MRLYCISQHGTVQDDIRGAFGQTCGENEIRSFLVDGDTVPVTVRIPASLRDCAKEAAVLRGMSFSAFMRACMIDELAKGGRK